ncbi:MAG: hydrogenase maturation nickel metallochaperone HypA [Planctomycetota bacterium]
MHELSIATQLIRQVMEHAVQSRLVRIDEVELEVGALQMIVPDALDLAFQVLSKDTLAEGAVLRLVEVPLKAECRTCSRLFTATIESFQCPSCGQADAEIVMGREIILKSITGQVDEEGVTS